MMPLKDLFDKYLIIGSNNVVGEIVSIYNSNNSSPTSKIFHPTDATSKNGETK